MNKKYFTPKKIHAYLRAAIQLVFFLFLPSAFTTAFSGIKSVLTQIGAGNPIAWSSFLTVLLALCAYTIVFGRFFCGYACAFGTLGDAVHSLYLFLCKKCKKKPLLLKKSWKKPLSYLKYAVLLAVVLLCFLGVYGDLTGWSPWDAFSMLRSGNFKVGAYWLGCSWWEWYSVSVSSAVSCVLWVLFSPCCPFCRFSRCGAKGKNAPKAVLPVKRYARRICPCRRTAAGM